MSYNHHIFPMWRENILNYKHTANVTRGGIGGYRDLSNGNVPVWSPKNYIKDAQVSF